MPNDDGSINVLAITKLSVAAPQILSSPGASMVFTSQFALPSPLFVVSQAQIQQQYGAVSQTLNAVQQSFQLRQQNKPDQGQDNQQGGDTQGVGEGGQQNEGGAGQRAKWRASHWRNPSKSSRRVKPPRRHLKRVRRPNLGWKRR